MCCRYQICKVHGLPRTPHPACQNATTAAAVSGRSETAETARAASLSCRKAERCVKSSNHFARCPAGTDARKYKDPEAPERTSRQASRPPRQWAAVSPSLVRLRPIDRTPDSQPTAAGGTQSSALSRFFCCQFPHRRQRRFGHFDALLRGLLCQRFAPIPGHAHALVLQHRGQQRLDALAVDCRARQRSRIDSNKRLSDARLIAFFFKKRVGFRTESARRSAWSRAVRR